jgi:D-glycero-alpha-D-manno-heptose 1-phosphate guanylyltransferase
MDETEMCHENSIEVIILAGGLGTRLREVVKDVPKPMATICGKPFLWYIFDWLKEYKVRLAIVSAGSGSEKIIEYFGRKFQGIPVFYAVEEFRLGTGGAVMYALRYTQGENVLIVNGDTYFPVDLNNFSLFHKNNKGKISLALKLMRDFSRYGSVECHNNIITRFNEKKYCNDGLINGGIYLINRTFIEAKNLPEIFSFEKELLEKEAGSGNLGCMVFDNPFIDIGVPEDYYRAESFLRDIGRTGKDE